MKLAVIYDSKTGNTRQAAEWIAEGMNRVPEAEARAFHIGEVDADFVKESKGVVMGCPTYAALMTPDMRTWLMTSAGRFPGAIQRYSARPTKAAAKVVNSV